MSTVAASTWSWTTPSSPRADGTGGRRGRRTSEAIGGSMKTASCRRTRAATLISSGAARRSWRIPRPIAESSVEKPAPVHQEGLAGDEAAGLAGEEHDGVGDVLRAPAALERLGLQDLPFHLGEVAPREALRSGGEGTGGDRIYADVLGAYFTREGAGETDHGSLGGHVMDEPRVSHEEGDRRDAHDRAAPAPREVGMEGLATGEVAARIDREHPVPLGFVDLDPWPRGINRGVVDQDVGSSQAVRGGRGQRGHRGDVRDVGLEGKRVPSGGDDRRRGRLEGEGRGPAEAGTGSGDHRDLAAQIHGPHPRDYSGTVRNRNSDFYTRSGGRGDFVPDRIARPEAGVVSPPPGTAGCRR